MKNFSDLASNKHIPSVEAIHRALQKKGSGKKNPDS